MILFWKNVNRYPKFFFTSLVGLIIILTSPFRKLFKSSNKIFFLVTILGLSLTVFVFSQMLDL